VNARCSECGREFRIGRANERFFFKEAARFDSIACLRQYIRRTRRRSRLPAAVRDVQPDERMADGLSFSPMLGGSFRSCFEVAVAETIVCAWGIPLLYEPHVVEVGTRVYIPDFFVPWHSVWLEVKGEWRSGSKAKFGRALDILGPERLIIVPPLYRREFDGAAQGLYRGSLRRQIR